MCITWLPLLVVVPRIDSTKNRGIAAYAVNRRSGGNFRGESCVSRDNNTALCRVGLSLT